eukprot:1965610-Rhodomonas_salina.1
MWRAFVAFCIADSRITGILPASKTAVEAYLAYLVVCGYHPHSVLAHLSARAIRYQHQRLRVRWEHS